MRGALLFMVLIGASPSLAQPAKDILMQPAEDVNLKKREIPAVLADATAGPYAQSGTRSCSQVTASLDALDAALGPDFDAGEPRRTGLTAGRVAEHVVASFVPFRSVVREVSGAAPAERRYQAAVDAGIARRGYLRGIARMKGCKVGGSKSAGS